MDVQPAELVQQCCRDGGPTQPDQLTIGQLARLTGVRAKTIRYYEQIGLLPQPPRATNGYRRYSAADLNRLHLLRRIRFLGVPLSVAQPLLAEAVMRAAQTCNTNC